MTIDDIRSRSLALTREIREAERAGNMEVVYHLMRTKQPLVQLLYQHGCAVAQRGAENGS